MKGHPLLWSVTRTAQVMVIPAPKQGGSLIEHVVKTRNVYLSVSGYTCNHQQNVQTGNCMTSTNFVEKK